MHHEPRWDLYVRQLRLWSPYRNDIHHRRLRLLGLEHRRTLLGLAEYRIRHVELRLMLDFLLPIILGQWLGFIVILAIGLIALGVEKLRALFLSRSTTLASPKEFR